VNGASEGVGLMGKQDAVSKERGLVAKGLLGG